MSSRACADSRLDPCRLAGLVLSLALSTASLGCDEHAGRVLVVIGSDLGVTGELSSVEVRIVGAQDPLRFPLLPAGTQATSRAWPLPLSFVVRPRGGDSSRVVKLEVRGFGSAGEVLSNRRIRGFVPNETRVLPIHLSRSCLDDPCDVETSYCDRGICYSNEVNVRELPLARREGDVPPALDAGVGTPVDPPSWVEVPDLEIASAGFITPMSDGTAALPDVVVMGRTRTTAVGTARRYTLTRHASGAPLLRPVAEDVHVGVNIQAFAHQLGVGTAIAADDVSGGAAQSVFALIDERWMFSNPYDRPGTLDDGVTGIDMLLSDLPNVCFVASRYVLDGGMVRYGGVGRFDFPRMPQWSWTPASTTLHCGTFLRDEMSVTTPAALCIDLATPRPGLAFAQTATRGAPFAFANTLTIRGVAVTRTLLAIVGTFSGQMTRMESTDELLPEATSESGYLLLATRVGVTGTAVQAFLLSNPATAFSPRAVAYDVPTGRIWVAGDLTGAASFTGPTDTITADGTDALIVGYQIAGSETLPMIHFGGPGDQRVTALSIATNTSETQRGFVTIEAETGLGATRCAATTPCSFLAPFTPE